VTTPLHCAVAPVVVLTLVSATGRARADASAADKAAARELGIAGIQLADKGECAAAIPKLQTAAGLYAAPTIVERLGECQIAMGKLVAGTESLQSVLHQDLGPTPNPVFVDAQKRAQKALEAARPHIAKIVIHVTGPRPEDANVAVDGERVPAALLDGDRPTDPGGHQVIASAPGFKTAATSILVGDGARSEVTLVLEPTPPAAAPVLPVPPTATTPSAPTPAPTPAAPTPAAPGPVTQAPGTTPPPTETPANGEGRSLALPIVSFVVGAAGLAVGATFGMLAINKKSSLDSACAADKSCPSTSQSDIDSLNSNALISTIGWVAGGVGIGAGLVFLVVGGGGQKAPAAPAHGEITPVLGPASLGLRGSF
jgi:hypothetical protein